jgi:hypothetical protein
MPSIPAPPPPVLGRQQTSAADLWRQVQRAAESSPILHQVLVYHQHGLVTREEALMIAAVAQAEEHHTLVARCLELMQGQRPVFAVDGLGGEGDNPQSAIVNPQSGRATDGQDART